MKYIVMFISVLSMLFASNTISKIKKSKIELDTTLQEKKKATLQLDKIAAEIKKTKKELAVIDKILEELSQDEISTQKKYKSLKKELDSYQSDIQETQTKLDDKTEKFLTLLSEQFSTIFAMQQVHEPTKESIIYKDIYQAYKKQNEAILKGLSKDIKKLKEYKAKRIKQKDKIEQELQEIIVKQQEYQEQKDKKKKLLVKLEANENMYTTKLAKIADRQNALREKLAQLNILREQEVLEAKKIAEARKRAIAAERERQRKLRIAKEKARKKEREAKLALKKAKDAKARAKAKKEALAAEEERKRIAKESKKRINLNSSYKKEKIYAYRGSKTISPIPGAKIIKKFGTYIDPLYNMKIFNDNIILKAPKYNAKVHNVLNGKVVYAGNSSMLGKVVVILHSNKIHTIYAGLSQIAPSIKVGRKLKKGYVIGKVKRKLMFQATKNSKHINPLRLIEL